VTAISRLLPPAAPRAGASLALAGACALLLAACAQAPKPDPNAAALAAAAAASAPRYPVAPAKPVTHEYHGVAVTDGFEWLENAADPEVKRWVAQENAFSRQYLDAIPARPALQTRKGIEGCF